LRFLSFIFLPGADVNNPAFCIANAADCHWHKKIQPSKQPLPLKYSLIK